MKIYTKTGDAGTTALLGGTRVGKNHLRLEAYGSLDELNSWIGLLRDFTVNSSRREPLKKIQDMIFTLGSHLATAPGKKIRHLPSYTSEDVTALEQEIDQMEEDLAPLQNFILPGGHAEVSQCHIARCVCRRAERLVVALHEHEPLDEIILAFLNRLSDYLFVLARRMSHELGATEVPWQPRKLAD
ncbi:ATP:cob(I)alamin adenosyltransferase [Flammeovirgaceae bacterium 311]|nr:ATP:cob(I)alamin adenosyltransferase [Flammeovirgaceae bacterium 311]